MSHDAEETGKNKLWKTIWNVLMATNLGVASYSAHTNDDMRLSIKDLERTMTINMVKSDEVKTEIKSEIVGLREDVAVLKERVRALERIQDAARLPATTP